MEPHRHIEHNRKETHRNLCESLCSYDPMWFKIQTGTLPKSVIAFDSSFNFLSCSKFNT